MMANRTATLRAIPGVLAEAMQTTLALTPSSETPRNEKWHCP